MKTIWKFPFMIQEKVEIIMPDNAEILCVQVQRDTPCLWALVDPSVPTEKRHFRILETGERVSGGAFRKHIGTFQMADGTLVFHMFETN